MAESYLELPAPEQKDILQAAAAEMGRLETVLEKDIWVCWALQTLFSMPNAHPMAFKGGTSLSKVYGVIDRFSEDIDITLDYRRFDDAFDPFADSANSTQIRKFSARLKGYVKEYANEVVAPFVRDQLGKLPFADLHAVEIDEAGEKIWISFPSVTESRDNYLKSQVLVELGGRNVIDPNETHKIFPYVAELTNDLSFPNGDIVVLSPERTFWEKATLIHVECNRGRLKNNVERLSRHWYDLTMLAQHAAGQSAIRNRDLFEDVIRHKKVFFNASYANYDACLDGTLKILPGDGIIRGLEVDYSRMIRAGMMYGSPPTFEEILEATRALERDINTW